MNKAGFKLCVIVMDSESGESLADEVTDIKKEDTQITLERSLYSNL